MCFYISVYINLVWEHIAQYVYSSQDDATDKPIALGVKQTPAQTNVENYVCILCQEASTINDDSTVVYAALIQK